MRKQYFVLLLGLIVAAGVMFTGCSDMEYTWKFENHTKQIIQVESQDLDPSFFEMPAYTGTVEQLLVEGEGAAPAVSRQTATSTKASPTIGWICKNQTAAWSQNNVRMEQSGTVIRFKIISGDSGGFAKIKQAE